MEPPNSYSSEPYPCPSSTPPKTQGKITQEHTSTKKIAKRNQVVPGLEPGIREINDFDESKSHVLTATLYNQKLMCLTQNAAIMHNTPTIDLWQNDVNLLER
jgi:hypothetical protein